MTRKRTRYPIPAAEHMGRNLDEGPPVIMSRGYTVAAWTPERDGQGTPTAVLLINHLDRAAGGCDIAMRIKSRPEIERLITILGQYADTVWPERRT